MKKPHPHLGDLSDNEKRLNVMAYALGRRWCSWGWPVATNPFPKISYPLEHEAFTRAWGHWRDHYAAAGVVFRTRQELEDFERHRIFRYITRYTARHPSAVQTRPRRLKGE